MSLFADFLKNAPRTVKQAVAESAGEVALEITKEMCATDMSLFAKRYFPEVFELAWCEFHTTLMDDLEEMTLNRNDVKQHYLRAAPRGHGKSQIISYLYVLWCICFQLKRNILVVSDTNPQAKQFIMSIKNELEENELLRQDFGDLVGKVIWAQHQIVTSTGIQVTAKGAGQKLRGIKSFIDNKRPDAIIIDDLENDENVETENQRNKLKSWMLKALMPCGCPTVHYIYIGTILHYESLLNVMLTDVKFAYWNRKIYRAITKFSESPLWAEWEKIINDLERENPAEDAYAFYQEHREEMLEGVEALWTDQGKDYYYDLMVLRNTDEASFNSEYQNEPIDPSKAEFFENWYQYYDDLPEIVAVYGACDPSMGKEKSDCSAIVWLGKGRDNYLYVLDVEIQRRTPDMIMDALFRGAITYQDLLKSITIETVQFQEMFADEFRRRSMAAGFLMPINEVKTHTDKKLRLRGLIPKIKNGYIRFKRSQQILLNEFRRFPKGRDDGMDALEMAVSAAYPKVGSLVFGSIKMARG